MLEKEDNFTPTGSFEMGGNIYRGRYGNHPIDTRVLKEKFEIGKYSDKRTRLVYAVLTNLKHGKVLDVPSIVKRNGYIHYSFTSKMNGYLSINNVSFAMKAIETTITKGGNLNKGITKILIEKIS